MKHTASAVRGLIKCQCGDYMINCLKGHLAARATARPQRQPRPSVDPSLAERIVKSTQYA